MLKIIFWILLLPFRLVCVYPGQITLLLSYFFPERGRAALTRRQHKEGGLLMKIFKSCMLWVSIAIFILTLVK